MAAIAAAVPIPAGTELHVRLQTPVATSAPEHHTIQAVVIVPVMTGDQVLIPDGTRVAGDVKERRAVTKPDERALLRLDFSKLIRPDGKTARIDSTVVDVDNARESVDAKGDIIGILASETLAARMDRAIQKVSSRYPELGDLLEGMKRGLGVGEANPDIKYDAGVEMTLRLNKPLDWDRPGEGAGWAFRPVEPESELYDVVNRQPYRTYAQRPPEPSDLTNVMFVGTADEIRRAFERAGWTTAEELSQKSTMETVRAVIEGRGYKEAPVSILLLDGRPPDMVFQKQNDTFAQRHHLRIWQRGDEFRGKPVWVCAGTHDIGIDFSADNGTFIHRIDPQIDRERAKVVNDLMFTRIPKGVSLVERPDVPKQASNATGDELITDGRMAVLAF